VRGQISLIQYRIVSGATVGEQTFAFSLPSCSYSFVFQVGLFPSQAASPGPSPLGGSARSAGGEV